LKIQPPVGMLELNQSCLNRVVQLFGVERDGIRLKYREKLKPHNAQRDEDLVGGAIKGW
jgi:hypothetical protein